MRLFGRYAYAEHGLEVAAVHPIPLNSSGFAKVIRLVSTIKWDTAGKANTVRLTKNNFRQTKGKWTNLRSKILTRYAWGLDAWLEAA